MVCRTSVCTLPCEVRTQPASTKLRDEVVVTVPVTGSAVRSIPRVAMLGFGAPMVFVVTWPVTFVEIVVEEEQQRSRGGEVLTVPGDVNRDSVRLTIAEHARERRQVDAIRDEV